MLPPARRTRRPLVIASVMASMFMVAVESTIVSTAMPQIVAQLGGLEFYSWVFSSFLLTQTATTVIFGKLSDVLGRKPVLLAGIAIFLLGSVLCGFAWSMPSMVAFRLLQGIGAGAVSPVALTVVGDLYSAEERGRIQGFLASVWGVSAVAGPLAGGLIIQHLSWAWVFWINLPVGLLSASGFWLFLHETDERERRPIDLAGAALFTAAVAALMVGLTSAGTRDWDHALPAAALCVVALGLFALQERRAVEPMISLGLWGRRPIAAANLASLLAGIAVIGVTTFLPVYVQGVLGRSPLVAGFALTVMVLGWPTGATLAARSYGRFGIRPVMLLGCGLIPLGALAMVALGPGSSPVLAGAGSLVMGFGMGLFSTTSIVLIQEIVGWAERGSATASNLFSRNLGSTLGATLFGAVLNFGLGHFGRDAGQAPIGAEQVRELLDRAGGPSLGEPVARLVLHQSLHLTFWAVLVCSALIGLAASFVPAVRLGRGREGAAR